MPPEPPIDNNLRVSDQKGFMSVVIPIVVNKGQHPEQNTIIFDNDDSTIIHLNSPHKKPLHQHYALPDNISSGGQVTGKMTNNRNSVNVPVLNIDKIEMPY